MKVFQEKYTFDLRQAESARIRNKYPDRVPIIVEQQKKSSLPELDKHKYLVPGDLTVGQFMHVLRKRMKMPPEEALFIFMNNKIPPSSSLVSHVYQNDKNEDGFLYCIVAKENVFGSEL